MKLRRGFAQEKRRILTGQEAVAAVAASALDTHAHAQQALLPVSGGTQSSDGMLFPPSLFEIYLYEW